MDSFLRRTPFFLSDKRATRAAKRARWSFVAAQSARATASIFAISVLPSCAGQSDDPRDAFFDNMMALCGGSYLGQITSDQAEDADWIASVLVVGPVTCEADVIRMPLAVGEDTSRTWVVSRSDGELEFRHEHTEPDGSPSAVTQYGGFARLGGSPTRQDFPTDELTRENFYENGLIVSLPNIWTLTFDGQTLGYGLSRPATETDPARDFRAVFNAQP